MDNPRLSVIMPVFNTGPFLAEAIDSVLQQQGLDGRALPSFELIVIDDGSTDAETLAILLDKGRDHRVRVLSNQRNKGAAGARNSGIELARGEWIGFLDSDDLWFPHSLAQRWRVVEREGVRWVAGAFRFLRSINEEKTGQRFPSASTLFAELIERTDAPFRHLVRPVSEFGEQCMIQTSTVLVERSLLIEAGMFNEQLPRAEDYHLWFQCAFENDLWLVDAELTFYRIHGGSLTHGDTPRFLHEDKMIADLLCHPIGRRHAPVLMRRFDLIMQDHCYFFRAHRQFGSALSFAWRWTWKRPLNRAAWKEVMAGALRAG